MRFRFDSTPTVAAAALALLGLCASAGTAPAAPAWTRLRSPNFTFEGNVPESDLRAVARRFEQFREVLDRLMKDVSLVTPTPLTIVVFAHDQDFKPARPLFNGKPVEAAAYVQGSRVGTSIALSLEHGEAAYPLIYHEYGHLLINNAVPRLPVWASEGLAEYYKTFELSADGRRAVVGNPLSADEIAQMKGRNLIPMADFLSAGHDSALYNVSRDRGLFYAQSWALVHYLLLGSPARQGQFDRFLMQVAAEVPAADAFKATITSPEKLDAELTQYVRSMTFRAMQFTFKEKVVDDRGYAAVKMSPADVECVYGHLLLPQKRYAEARTRFAAALKIDPKASSAHTGMGLIEFDQGRPLEALPELRLGVEYGADNVLAHYGLGLALLNCRSAECEAQQAGDEAARRSLQRAVELLPQFPDALSFLGYTELATGKSLEDAEKHLKAAIALIPGREDYRFHLAQVYMQTRQFEQAQAILGPLAASPDKAQSSQARQLLGRLAALKNAAAGVRPDGTWEAPTAGSGAGGAGDRPAGGAGRSTPVFRQTAEGERRLEGTFVSIECPRAGPVAVVRDAAGLHRFAISALEKVEFITYRDDLTGKIGCGPQPAGMNVYVTFRAPASGEPPLAAGLEGIVVAVEFLPKDK